MFLVLCYVHINENPETAVLQFPDFMIYLTQSTLPKLEKRDRPQYEKTLFYDRNQIR